MLAAMSHAANDDLFVSPVSADHVPVPRASALLVSNEEEKRGRKEERKKRRKS